MGERHVIRLFVLSWLQQGLRAIPSSAQTVTYCCGSVPNVIHSRYLMAAVIKCIVKWIDGTVCNAVTTYEGQSHVAGV